MKVIILAAGEGKRLRPYTSDCPKCMIKINNKSLLEMQINVFQSLGIKDISVVTGYRKDMINFPNVKYFSNDNYENTNMLETLFCAKEKIDGEVIVSYGDIIFEKKNLLKLIESKHDFSVVVDKHWKKYWNLRLENPLDDLESLQISSEGNIESIGQKVNNLEEIQGQYIGLMKFQNTAIKDIINYYDKVKNLSKIGENPLNENIPFEKSYMTDFLQGLIDEKYKIYPVFIENGWLELDSVEDLKLYEEMIKNDTIKEIIDLNNVSF